MAGTLMMTADLLCVCVCVCVCVQATNPIGTELLRKRPVTDNTLTSVKFTLSLYLVSNRSFAKAHTSLHRK